MKKRLQLFSTGLLAIGLFSVAAITPRFGDSPEPEKEALIVQSILRNLDRYHFDPTAIDDNFSAQAFDYYLNDIDGARLFFTQEDIAVLQGYRDQLDEQVATGSFDFFNNTQKIWEANRGKARAWYTDILSKPFNLNNEGTIVLRGETSEWNANDEELRAYWHDYLKRDALRRITNKQEAAEKDEDVELPSLEVLEAEVRAEILETYDSWFDRLDKVKRSQRLSQYVNALTSMYDPHTTYFLPRDKENFDIRFSGRLEGIGATLQTDGDFTKVTSLVVGGPAWKGKELKEDDIITAVRQEGEEKAVDIKGMTIDDVVSKIRGPKDTKVYLTVKQATGELVEIMIVRDIVVIDERFARSLIIDGAVDGEKIGYIYLPSFYADFQNEDGHFCSQDVALELEKLKAAQVDGIVLDLRNNGGGSLADVVKMTGFFIPEGPIVQVQDRINNTEVLRDKDDRVQYDGPLAIMVNQSSASASEILAAALQDYDRAVIIGSTSTFGKGTVQRFLDLDRTLRGHAEVKPLGTIKLTMQKFFRINGGSTQLRGVVPDIILPDTYSYLEVGEKKQTNPLEWTQIDPVDYGQNVFQIGDRDWLRKRSAERVEQNPTFALIEENAQRFKRIRDRDSYPMSLGGYQQAEQALDDEAKRFENLFKDVINEGVANLAVDLTTFEGDESKTARNEEFIKDVSRDVYIHESIQVIHDLISKQ